MTLSDKMAGGAAVDAAPRRAAARQKPVWTATLSLLVALWVPAFALVIWFISSRGSDSPYFPPLSDILAVIPRDFIEGDHFFTDVLPSMGVVLAGLALASVIGIVGGYLIAMSRFALSVTRPVIDVFRSVPAVALVPVAIVILGPGFSSEIALVTLSALWPILLSTIAGVSGTEPTYLEVARLSRLSALQRFWHVSIPAAAPAIAAGIHTSLALSVIVMVTMEMFASTEGIGRYLISAQRSFAIPVSFAGAIVVGLMGYGLSVAFSLIERSALSWYYERQSIFKPQGA